MTKAPNELVLEADSVRAVLDPLGGRVSSLVVRGHELLAPPVGNRLQTGCYPLAPWAGRLGQGRFKFEGLEHQLPLSLPPHAIHGLVWDQPWTPAGPGALSVGLDRFWPLGGIVDVRYRLAESHLECELTITAESEALPAVLGWHPCLARSIAGVDATLQFEPGFMWARGDDGLPTAQQSAVPAGPWDDCFGGVSSSPRLRYGDELDLTLVAPTATWVVFDELDSIICVEPQTGVPDGFNRDDFTTLQEGESLSLSLDIAWS